MQISKISIRSLKTAVTNVPILLSCNLSCRNVGTKGTSMNTLKAYLAARLQSHDSQGIRYYFPGRLIIGRGATLKTLQALESFLATFGLVGQHTCQGKKNSTAWTTNLCQLGQSYGIIAMKSMIFILLSPKHEDATMQNM